MIRASCSRRRHLLGSAPLAEPQVAQTEPHGAGGRQRTAIPLAALRPGFLVAAFGLLSLFAQVATAAASCSQLESDPRCRSEFGRFTAVSWVADRYVVVGRLRNRNPATPALILVSADGRPSEPISLPAWRGASQAEVELVEFHKIVALPNHLLALIGSFRPANSPWLAGLVLAVDNSGGRLRWVGERLDPSANVLFQSGVYDAASNVLIAVGRVTAGSDDGSCRNWSRSYVQGFDIASGALAEPLILAGEALLAQTTAKRSTTSCRPPSPEHMRSWASRPSRTRPLAAAKT